MKRRLRRRDGMAGGEEAEDGENSSTASGNGLRDGKRRVGMERRMELEQGSERGLFISVWAQWAPGGQDAWWPTRTRPRIWGLTGYPGRWVVGKRKLPRGVSGARRAWLQGHWGPRRFAPLSSGVRPAFGCKRLISPLHTGWEVPMDESLRIPHAASQFVDATPCPQSAFLCSDVRLERKPNCPARQLPRPARPFGSVEKPCHCV